MKYLSVSVTALFLIASPLAAMAQNNDSNGGNNNGGSSGTNSGGDGTGNMGSQKSDCSDVVAGSLYESFSEKCRLQIDKWASEQAADRNINYEGDITVGTVVPESVEIIEVPAYSSYGYVMLNNKRVLVDRESRKVVRVY